MPTRRIYPTTTHILPKSYRQQPDTATPGAQAYLKQQPGPTDKPNLPIPILLIDMSNKPKKSKISTLDDLIRLLDILNITDRKKNKTRQHQFLQAEEEMAYINRVVEKAKTKSNR